MRSLIGILTVLILSATGVCADTRMFHLRHRPAADIIETVRAALGNEARVVAADHSLFVNASPSELSAVAELLGILDRPPTMLRIVIDQNRETMSEDMSVDASGNVSIGSGTVVIGRSAPLRHGEAYGERDGVRIGTSSSRYRESRRAEQFVVALEGRPARISVGRRIPFAERWLLLARRHAQIVEAIRYEAVDTGFDVRPELIDGRVQLAIHPFMAFQDPLQPCEIVFQELATTVRIPLGEWYDLGGTMAVRDEVSREILAGGNQAGEGGGIVRIKVELQPD